MTKNLETAGDHKKPCKKGDPVWLARSTRAWLIGLVLWTVSADVCGAFVAEI